MTLRLHPDCRAFALCGGMFVTSDVSQSSQNCLLVICLIGWVYDGFVYILCSKQTLFQDYYRQYMRETSIADSMQF